MHNIRNQYKPKVNQENARFRDNSFISSVQNDEDRANSLTDYMIWSEYHHKQSHLTKKRSRSILDPVEDPLQIQ